MTFNLRLMLAICAARDAGFEQFAAALAELLKQELNRKNL